MRKKEKTKCSFIVKQHGEKTQADMSDDVLEQILTHLKESPSYFIQLDEPTDIAGLPQLQSFLFTTSTVLLYQKICYFAKHYNCTQRVKIFFNA